MGAAHRIGDRRRARRDRIISHVSDVAAAAIATPAPDRPMMIAAALIVAGLVVIAVWIRQCRKSVLPKPQPRPRRR